MMRRYGSHLPTPLPMLVYQPSTGGCSHWRPAAFLGMVWYENCTLPLGFSEASRSAQDTAANRDLVNHVEIWQSDHHVLFRPSAMKSCMCRRGGPPTLEPPHPRPPFLENPLAPDLLTLTPLP